MKNKKLFQRLMGIGCATLMGVSLVGCGGGELGKNDSFGWEEDPNFVAKEIWDRETYPGGSGMNDDVLTIANWMLDNFNTGKNEHTEVYNMLEEKAGMPIEANVLGDNDWKTQISTWYNTTMLPDLFVTMGPESADEYKSMIQEGILVPVSDYVDSTHYPNLYNYLKKFNYLRANIPYADGKLWSIPVGWQMEHTMYVRLDWIKNLNNKIEAVLTAEGRDPSSMTSQQIEDAKFTATGPVDLTEFYRLAWAFTYCDPDGDGKNNTYGYTNAAKDDMFTDCWIFEAFGAGYDRMVDSDGDGVYESSYSNDNTKKALAFLNKMVKDGIMDPGFFENDMGGKQDDFTGGKVGMMEAHVWYNVILKSYMGAKGVADPTEAQIAQYAQDIGMFNPPVGEDGKSGINGNPNFWTVICLNAGMSDEELDAALKLFDYLYSDEGQEFITNGTENVHYTVSGGKKVSTFSRTKGWLNNFATEDGAASIQSICSLSSGYLSCHQDNAEKINAQMNEAKKYAAFADYPFLQPEAYVTYWSAMKTYAQEQFMIIIRDTSISSNADIKNPSFTDLNNLSNGSAFTNRWNSFVDALKGQHLEEVETAYNNAIQNGGMKVTKADIGMAD